MKMLQINPRTPQLNAAKLRKGGKRAGTSTYLHMNGAGYDSLKAPKMSYNGKSALPAPKPCRANIRPPQLMDYRKMSHPLSADQAMAAML